MGKGAIERYEKCESLKSEKSLKENRPFLRYKEVDSLRGSPLRCVSRLRGNDRGGAMNHVGFMVLIGKRFLIYLVGQRIIINSN